MTTDLARETFQRDRIEVAYRGYSLIQLVCRIVEHSDELALRELHDHRTAFRGSNDRPVRLSEYVLLLRHTRLAASLAGSNTFILDKAYDLTLDKFCHLPDRNESICEGPDARRYFAAFLKHLAKRLPSETQANPLEEEAIASNVLQGMVARHFYLSCRECARASNPLIRRYFWHVNGTVLCVWLPAHMNGRQCRSWLGDNMATLNPRRKGERDRVQAIIDRRLLLPRTLSATRFDGRVAAESPAPQCAAGDLVNEISVHGLAEVVAEEKAENIEQQRPTIRALGKRALIGLIRRVFDDLSCETYDLSKVAYSFGLSKATLSRFAGIRWSANGNRNRLAAVPDLWRNTAQTLAGHSDFVDAARSAGVWPTVEAVAIPWGEQR